jgi:2-oxo-4-hydroxy-4-carboxy-5-ureidoimidazoline decarboxylase
MKKPFTLAQINSLSREDFVCVIGPVFEDSPWIADATWSKRPLRPFKSIDALHGALCKTVQASKEDKQVDLIRAHPDLVGRAALAGTLTAASTSEQASAGLDKLTADEISLFQKLNQTYRDKFGFPFVICARLNKKEAILKGFEVRLEHSRKEEIKTALAEIEKIAYLRLQDIIES